MSSRTYGNKLATTAAGALTALALAACGGTQGPTPGFDPGAPMTVKNSGDATVNGAEAPLATVKQHDNGFFMPDGQGGVIWSPGKPRPEQNAAYMDARELKLKVRELADQLISSMPNDALAGYVALPASFVNQDNFDESSAFGRFLAESLFYEFNQRSFPVREYRLPGTLRTIEGEGEFVLSRSIPTLPGRESWAVFVTGTYYRDPTAIFVNARLIRAADGMVLRTGQLVLQPNQLLARMLRNNLRGGTMHIAPASEATPAPAYLPKTPTSGKAKKSKTSNSTSAPKKQV